MAHPLEPDLETAIGLVWGHLGTRQFRQAATLARGCLSVWPGQPLLTRLGARAAGELGESLAPQAAALLRLPEYASLAAQLARRVPLGAEQAP